MGDDDANSKEKNEKDEVNAANKSGKKTTEDADEITDRSATNSEYILCK